MGWGNPRDFLWQLFLFARDRSPPSSEVALNSEHNKFGSVFVEFLIKTHIVPSGFPRILAEPIWSTLPNSVCILGGVPLVIWCGSMMYYSAAALLFWCMVHLHEQFMGSSMATISHLTIHSPS